MAGLKRAQIVGDAGFIDRFSKGDATAIAVANAADLAISTSTEKPLDRGWSAPEVVRGWPICAEISNERRTN
jgi:hypothetical protein